MNETNPSTERLTAEAREAMRERAMRPTKHVWPDDAEIAAHYRTDIPALLAHISVLEAELQLKQGDVEDREREIGNLIHQRNEALGQCGELHRRIATLEAELQEAREQNKRVENWRNNLFDYLMSEDAVVKKATNNFRSQLVAAVRNCDWHVDDNVMKLIQSFNPAPDDVVTRLASPVHDEEPNL